MDRKAKLIMWGRGGVQAFMPTVDNTTCKIQGYAGHSWTEHCGDDTVVMDSRYADIRMVTRFACWGPIPNVDLPDGTVEKCMGERSQWQDIGEFGQHANGDPVKPLDSVSLDVYMLIASRFDYTVGRGMSAMPSDAVRSPQCNLA